MFTFLYFIIKSQFELLSSIYHKYLNIKQQKWQHIKYFDKIIKKNTNVHKVTMEYGLNLQIKLLNISYYNINM